MSSLRFAALALLAVLLAGCASGPRLRLAPDQAEFPFGTGVVVDGRLGANEWSQARRLAVDLPDGRRIGILLERDRVNFYFAFVGMGEPAPREVRPQILIDTWGNGSRTHDRNDWWFAIGEELCWQREGFGEGECRTVPVGWDARRFPIAREEVVEVAISFAAVDFSESYEDLIGLAFRFVDDTGGEVAIWPLRAEVRHPDPWAQVSLTH